MVPAFVSNALVGKAVSTRELHRDHPIGADDWENECRRVTDYLELRGARGGAMEVWGWAPGLYWRTGTHPSSRFMMMIPLVMTGSSNTLTDYQRDWQREF